MARRTQEDPDRVTIGELSATPMRSRGENDRGQRYWRIRGPRPDRATLWTGWATRDEVQVEVAKLVAAGTTTSRRSRHAVVGTVGSLLVAWFDHQQQRHNGGNLAALSLKNYRIAVKHWRSVFEQVAVRQLTRAMVEDQLVAWQADVMSARSAKLHLDVLAAAWKWGTTRELCPRLELGRMSTVRPNDDEHEYCERTPTRAEVAAVVARCAPGRDRDLVLLLALTGVRVGEAAALRVGDANLVDRVLEVSGRDEGRARRGKVRRRRWPIVGELVDLVVRLTADRDAGEPLVAGLPGNVAHRSRWVLEQACAAANVERFTAHGLRRMVAMELLEVSDPKSVSQLTGHSVQTLLRYYVRPKASSLRDLVTRAGVGAVERRGKVRRLREVGASNRGTGPEDGE
jgi:integrase